VVSRTGKGKEEGFFNIQMQVKVKRTRNNRFLYYHPEEWDRFPRGIRQRFEEKRIREALIHNQQCYIESKGKANSRA